MERGKARCPRCGQAADYTFSEGEFGTLFYEVLCGGCGHAHCEQTVMTDVAA